MMVRQGINRYCGRGRDGEGEKEKRFGIRENGWYCGTAGREIGNRWEDRDTTRKGGASLPVEFLFFSLLSPFLGRIACQE